MEKTQKQRRSTGLVNRIKKALQTFTVVSFLFILLSTLFDVVFWGIFDYRYRFLNPVYYELLFTLGWTFIPLILSQKLSDYRIAYICTGYYLFNIEDLFFYLILSGKVPSTFNGIFALGVPNPPVEFVFIWEAIGVVFITLLCLIFGKEPRIVRTFNSFIVPAAICAFAIFALNTVILFFIPTSTHSIYFELFFVSWTVAPKLLSWKVLDARVAISSCSYFIFTHFTISWYFSIIFTLIITVMLLLSGKDFTFKWTSSINATTISR
ncbi:MAG: hypothetical protein ACP5OC_04130 [Thermoplasmata archaeon]